ANPDIYNSVVSGQTLTVSDPAKGLIANDVNVYGVKVMGSVAGLTLNLDGTFTYTGAPTSLTYCGNGATTAPACATVHLNAATLIFPQPSNLHLTPVDCITHTALAPQDYRWIIEEDRTFYLDPNCQRNPLPAGCTTATPEGVPSIFGTNFHSSYMPFVAQGCVGDNSCEIGQSVLGAPAACDIGNGVCRTGVSTKTAVDPSQVSLDTTKHYYISVMPGDAISNDDPNNPGHAMSGAEIVYLSGSWRSPL